tara:strand:+ start:384 stop:1034 length:651 start_codon:yes stop_codon:yes gene_type:complete
MANINKSTPRLDITIGAEYNYQDKQLLVGKKLKTTRAPIQSKNGKVYNQELFQSTGVWMHGEGGEGYLTPQSEPPIYVNTTTTIGSGTLGIDVSGTGTTCENSNYPGYGEEGETFFAKSSGVNPHYGYAFFENFEPTSGNYVYWGVDVPGTSSIIDGIEYQDFTAVGWMHPGDKVAFRILPSGTNIRFISASGLTALADGTVQNPTARMNYTLFPR